MFLINSLTIKTWKKNSKVELKKKKNTQTNHRPNSRNAEI